MQYEKKEKREFKGKNFPNTKIQKEKTTQKKY